MCKNEKLIEMQLHYIQWRPMARCFQWCQWYETFLNQEENKASGPTEIHRFIILIFLQVTKSKAEGCKTCIFKKVLTLLAQVHPLKTFVFIISPIAKPVLLASFYAIPKGLCGNERLSHSLTFLLIFAPQRIASIYITL